MPTYPDDIASERFPITLSDGTILKMPLISRWEDQFDQLHQDNNAINRIVVE